MSQQVSKPANKKSKQKQNCKLLEYSVPTRRIAAAFANVYLKQSSMFCAYCLSHFTLCEEIFSAHADEYIFFSEICFLKVSNLLLFSSVILSNPILWTQLLRTSALFLLCFLMVSDLLVFLSSATVLLFPTLMFKFNATNNNQWPSGKFQCAF